MLVAAKANLGFTHGRCALTEAAAESHAGVARALLELKASVDITDNQGRTPLTHTLCKHRVTSVHTLHTAWSPKARALESMLQQTEAGAALLNSGFPIAKNKIPNC